MSKVTSPSHTGKPGAPAAGPRRKPAARPVTEDDVTAYIREHHRAFPESAVHFATMSPAEQAEQRTFLAQKIAAGRSAFGQDVRRIARCVAALRRLMEQFAEEYTGEEYEAVMRGAGLQPAPEEKGYGPTWFEGAVEEVNGWVYVIHRLADTFEEYDVAPSVADRRAA